MKEKKETGTLRRRRKEWLWQIKFLWDCVGKNLLCFHGCHGNTVARVQQEMWWWNGEASWEVPTYLFEITVAAAGTVCSFAWRLYPKLDGVTSFSWMKASPLNFDVRCVNGCPEFVVVFMCVLIMGPCWCCFPDSLLERRCEPGARCSSWVLDGLKG